MDIPKNNELDCSEIKSIDVMRNVRLSMSQSKILLINKIFEENKFIDSFVFRYYLDVDEIENIVEYFDVFMNGITFDYDEFHKSELDIPKIQDDEKEREKFQDKIHSLWIKYREEFNLINHFLKYQYGNRILVEFYRNRISENSMYITEKEHDWTYDVGSLF